jgi:hypothetical protein
MASNAHGLFNLKTLIPLKTRVADTEPITGGGRKKKEPAVVITRVAPPQPQPQINFIEITAPRTSWSSVVPANTTIRYISAKDGKLKPICRISQVTANGFIVFARFGSSWKTWTILFDNIAKLFVHNRGGPAAAAPQPVVKREIFEELPAPPQQQPIAYSNTDLELLQKKIENIEIAQQNMESIIKRFNTLLVNPAAGSINI